MTERDEKYWRERANDVKALAATLKTAELRAELLVIAERYDQLAERTAGRSAKRKKDHADC
jgi:hypothetical protein